MELIETIRGHISGKKVLVLGYGREGSSTLRVLIAAGGFATLAVADQNPIEDTLPENVCSITGVHYQDAALDFDIVFKSPGVKLENRGAEISNRLTSQTDLFLSCYAGQTIGVTGTKGKSTTSSLIAHILEESGRDCVLAGNIGVPLFDVREAADRGAVIVAELSCHQLEYARHSPHIAVLLNIFEDHLDYYGTMERYKAAKDNIWLHQEPGDVFFCKAEILDSLDCAPAGAKGKGTARALENGINAQKNKPAYQSELSGRHNLFNIEAASLVCRELGIDEESVARGIQTFKPLPHRLEFFGEYGGVRWYDDSISTIGEATMTAVTSLPNVQTVLIGGMDRGIDYTPLENFLLETPELNVILMYASGWRIFSELASMAGDLPERVGYRETLSESVALAKTVTAPGKSCVLSPAAASYGDYKNFEERGERFKELVALQVL